jgi:ribosomal protein S18 acetylase RimI-like enzyme
MSAPLAEPSGQVYRIRPYEPRDRLAVWRLAADTAFFGDPVEAFLDDRALFCDAFVAYYTDWEPEHIWVAEGSGAVVGYLTGCRDNQRRGHILRAHILPRVLWGLIGCRYRIGHKTLRFGWRGVLAWVQRAGPHAALDRFPAHLHVNVATEVRGQGVGRALIEAMLAHFWGLGVPGVHVHTTSHNQAACHLYAKAGFYLLAAAPTSLWRGLVDGPIESRIYGIVPARHVAATRA